jgi:hypothetical protein
LRDVHRSERDRQSPGIGDQQSSHFVLATTFTLSSTGTTGGASLSINPTSVAEGSQVNLNGTGFAANEQVNLAVDGAVLTSAKSDGNGNSTTGITLPSSLTLGQHTISGTGVSSGRCASVGFDVTSGTPQGPTSCTDDNTRPRNGLAIGITATPGPRPQL